MKKYIIFILLILCLGAGRDRYSGGRIYGEIYCYESAAAVTLNSTGAKIQIPNFDTNGAYNGTTPDHTNDHIIIWSSGYYKTTVAASVSNGAGVGHTIDVSVWKNNGATEVANVHTHRTLAAGTDYGSLILSGIAYYVGGDTIELWAQTDRAINSAVTFTDITLTIEKL